MINETQTPAEETNDQSVTDSAVNGAADIDINDLLAEFDQNTEEVNQDKPELQATDQTSTPPVTAKLDPAQESRVAALEGMLYDQAINEAVKTVVGDSNMHHEVAKALLLQDSQNDPRIMRAWVNRQSNPVAFQKILSAKGLEYAKKLQPVDQDATQQKDDIVAAVQGTQTKTVPTTEQEEAAWNDKVSKMSDEELTTMMWANG